MIGCPLRTTSTGALEDGKLPGPVLAADAIFDERAQGFTAGRVAADEPADPS